MHVRVMCVCVSESESVCVRERVSERKEDLVGARKEEDVACPLATLYRDTSLIRKRNPLGPYRRPVPRVLGGWAFSYGRGTMSSTYCSLSPIETIS